MGEELKEDLWLVSELFYPESTSTGYIMTEISRKLSLSFNVHVIAGPIAYSNSNNQKDCSTFGLENIKIYRIKNLGYNKNRLLPRIKGQIFISLRLIGLMARKIKKGSKLLMVTNPILLLFFVSFISRLYRWKIFLLIHDVFPDNLVPSGIIKQRSILLKVIDYLFKRSYNQAYKIIVIGRDMKMLMANKCPNLRSEIIENWADIDSIDNLQLNQHEQNSNSESKLFFLFAGNIGRVQGIEALYQALMKVRHVNFEFTFMGNGALTKWLEQRIGENLEVNVSVQLARHREEQNVFLNNCDIGVISLSKGMYGIGVPSKFYNLLAAGKPIFYIGDDNTEIKLIIDEYQNGWYAEAGDPLSIITVIEQICRTNRAKILEMGLTSRYLAENVFSKALIMKKFESVFS